MKRYETVEQIRSAFIADGWSKETSFEAVTENGKRLYKMNETGNLYTDTGKLYRYNIQTSSKEA